MSARAFLVVGLGNPGPTYALSRHNVGFLAVDELARRHHATFSSAARHRAQVTAISLPAGDGEEDVSLRLAKPTTFMNESGVAVGALAAFHRIPPARIVVIHDELDLDPGQLRAKLGGGDNGHNGLRSIRAHLGTGDFLRVRVGIGRPPGRQPAADWVLQRMRPTDLAELRVDAAVAADAVAHLVRHGLAATQNLFNR